LARAEALKSGTPPDGSSKLTNKAAVDWWMMGGEAGTRGMTWEQIEDGVDKLRDEGQKKGPRHSNCSRPRGDDG